MSENKQDSITVEFPIRAHDDAYVKVDHVALVTRERWRQIAADPGGPDTPPLTARIAPAVVAWIERDEWKPLDLPEVGQRIRAELRDGSVVEGEVERVVELPKSDEPRVSVKLADHKEGDIAIPLSPDTMHGWYITAWEYVDEPAADLAAIADKITAAVTELREAIG